MLTRPPLSQSWLITLYESMTRKLNVDLLSRIYLCTLSWVSSILYHWTNFCISCDIDTVIKSVISDLAIMNQNNINVPNYSLIPIDKKPPSEFTLSVCVYISPVPIWGDQLTWPTLAGLNGRIDFKFQRYTWTKTPPTQPPPPHDRGTGRAALCTKS